MTPEDVKRLEDKLDRLIAMVEQIWNHTPMPGTMKVIVK